MEKKQRQDTIFTKIRSFGKSYITEFYTRRRREPKGEGLVGHRGPTPAPGAAGPCQARLGRVWPPGPTSGRATSRTSSSRGKNPKNRVVEAFLRCCRT